VSLMVTPVNDAPVASATSATTPEDSAVVITLSGTDADGDTLSYTLVTPSAHGSVTILGNTATYTPVANYNGTDSFTFAASDGQLQSASATVSLTVTPVNDAPVLTGPATAAVDEGGTFSLMLTLTDVDLTNEGDAHTYSGVGLPPWLNLNAITGQLSGNPVEADIGTTPGVQILVMDLGSLTSTHTLTLTVNDVLHAPQITNTPAGLVNTGANYSFLPTVFDLDSSDTHTFTISGKPAWASFDTATGALTGIPGGSAGGTYGNIQITVIDNTSLTGSTAVFSIVVTDVTAPAAPTSFSATSEATQVLLQWTNPSDPDLASFILLRRSDAAPTGPHDPMATAVATTGVSPTPGAAVSLVDAGISAGQIYQYALYAKDSSGNTSTSALATLSPVAYWGSAIFGTSKWGP